MVKVAVEIVVRSSVSQGKIDDAIAAVHSSLPLPFLLLLNPFPLLFMVCSTFLFFLQFHRDTSNSSSSFSFSPFSDFHIPSLFCSSLSSFPFSFSFFYSILTCLFLLLFLIFYDPSLIPPPPFTSAAPLIVFFLLLFVLLLLHSPHFFNLILHQSFLPSLTLLPSLHFITPTFSPPLYSAVPLLSFFSVIYTDIFYLLPRILCFLLLILFISSSFSP